jgi:uncharacterized membrane protein HdeD (DUF308 family)
MSPFMGRTFGLVLGFGIATVVLGLVLMIWPDATVVVVAILVGLYLLLTGVFLIVAGFESDTGGTGMRVLSAVAGVASLLLGIFAFRDISHAITILALIIGLGWVIRGIADLMDGFAKPGLPARGWVIFMGALSLVAGIVVLVWPDITLQALVWVIGLWLVVLGVIEVIGSFQLRKLARAT